MVLEAEGSREKQSFPQGGGGGEGGGGGRRRRRSGRRPGGGGRGGGRRRGVGGEYSTLSQPCSVAWQTSGTAVIQILFVAGFLGHSVLSIVLSAFPLCSVPSPPIPPTFVDEPQERNRARVWLDLVCRSIRSI